MIKVIIFDFDGVILESVDLKTKAFAELFKPEGREVVNKVVRYHLMNTGVSRFDKIKHIYKRFLKRELTRELFEKLCDDFANLVFDGVIKARYVKGAKIFLQNNSTRYRCFIISATPHKEIRLIARKRGLSRFFKGVYGAPYKKSNAVRWILRKEGVLPSEAVYIGDALSDFAAAKRNGVNFVARVRKNHRIFSGFKCLKINDLIGLRAILKNNFP